MNISSKQGTFLLLCAGLALSACSSSSAGGSSTEPNNPSGGLSGGGDSAGGANAAGSSGSGTGGSGTGGSGTAGSGTAGSGTAGSGTAGSGAAGAGNGGAGGSGAGGSGTAGSSAGGSAGSGAAGSPGTCQPATCGTHKWACWHMPNPASSGLPNAASYTDLGNGAVLDNLTCLTWEKAPSATQGVWQTNVDHCTSLSTSNFAGFSDWRLPTRIEMTSIVDYTRKGDAVNTTAFPKEPSAYYRTGSDWYETITGQNTSGFSWIFGMSSGFTSNAYAKTSNATVRCVRGNGTGEGQSDFAVAPPNQYTVASGEVTDNYTGLIWQQVDSAAGAGAAVIPWASAAGYCSSLALNGHSWRVPSINELSTLVDEAHVGPGINKTIFPNTKYGSYSNNWYWANAEYSGSTNGWAINFDDGFTGYNSGTATGKNGGPEWNYFTGAWVRCVR
ncbi:MAG TPA: DUF1566 domain-containing protein [Polyangiaceae bacterium]